MGAFLAGTATRRKDSISYLKKAAQLGVADAHYTMAFVYVTFDDKSNALTEFREYLKTYPDDKTAKKWVSDLENGSVNIQIKHEQPPDEVLVQKSAPLADPTPSAPRQPNERPGPKGPGSD